MRPVVLVLAALSISCFSPPGFAVDLMKIDRTIRKEPAYGTKPRYGLLVLGPKAETRIWLVVDGKTLYVDRNGNGDLTEKGDKVSAEKTESTDILHFEAGPFVEADGKSKHSTLTVYQYLTRQDSHPVNAVSVGDVLGMLGQGANGCAFAETAKEALVIHVNGPLTMRVYGAELDSRSGSRFAEYPFQVGAGERVSEFHVQVGTAGLGKGTFAAIAVEKKFPANVHPVVRLVIPSKTDPRKTIKAEFSLKERC